MYRGISCPVYIKPWRWPTVHNKTITLTSFKKDRYRKHSTGISLRYSHFYKTPRGTTCVHDAGLNYVHHDVFDLHVTIKIDSLKHVFKLTDDFHILVGIYRIGINHILDTIK